LDEEQSLHSAAERIVGELLDQVGIFRRVKHSSVAEQLKPGAMGVIHHEQGNPVIDLEVARADQLAVAFKIDLAPVLLRTRPDRRGVAHMASQSR
jgi:hypothetical protein